MVTHKEALITALFGECVQSLRRQNMSALFVCAYLIFDVCACVADLVQAPVRAKRSSTCPPPVICVQSELGGFIQSVICI